MVGDLEDDSDCFLNIEIYEYFVLIVYSYLEVEYICKCI